MSNPPKLMITQIKVGTNIVWQDPIWAYQQAIDKTEERLKTSEYKEAKELITRIIEKKSK